MNPEALNLHISQAVDSWSAWLPGWEPPKYKTRQRICRRCTGSPIRDAVGFAVDVPHQVVHAFITRMHRIIDREVDEYTKNFLPMLQAELDNQELWRKSVYNSKEGLPEDVADLEVDILVEEGDHPVLFTFAELEKDSSATQPQLPLPPLNTEEKLQLKKEMALAGERANRVGQELCFLLASHKSRVSKQVEIYIEPKIQLLLEDLSKSLETPTL